MPAPPSVLYTRAGLVGLCAGVLVSSQLPALPGLSLVPLLMACAGLGVLSRCPPGWCCCGICLGLTLASWQGHVSNLSRLPVDCTRTPVTLTGVVRDLPRVTLWYGQEYRQRFELRVHDIEPRRCAGPRRVLLSYYGEASIEPGQGWVFSARLRRPWGLENPGSHNFQAWYAAMGVDAIASASRHATRDVKLDKPWLSAHHRLRYRLAEKLADAPLTQRGRAVLQAITIADKSGIDHELWTVLQRNGVNHLMVVSGLHIGMVAVAALLASSLGCRPLRLLGIDTRRLPLLLSLCAALFYCGLAGFSLSTQRALVMFLCLVLARLLLRSARSGNGLGIAALVVLSLNPLAPLLSGFWLSFMAVAGLLWLSAWRARAGVADALMRAHVFMSLLMLPLGGMWFGGASLVAAAANLVAVPLFSLWVVPLALLGTLLALHDLGGATLLWQLASWPVEHLLDWATDYPDWTFLSLVPRTSSLVLAGLGIALLAVPVGGYCRALSGLVLLPLLLGPRADRGPLAVHVLDVGQGTSVVVTNGYEALLYDTGGGDPAGANMAQSVVLPFLRFRGIDQLDNLVISHGDLDHAAGLRTVLDHYTPRTFWQGGSGPLHTFATECEAGRAWRWSDGTRFRFLSPAGRAGLLSNDASCVLQIDSDRGRVLLSGDISSQQEYALLRYWRGDLASDVLLVGHHGSGSSTSQAWVNWVRPQVGVLNHGYANHFGHPHPDVQFRLASLGVDQWHTSRSGAISITFDEMGAVHVTGYRPGIESWWK